jgi:two-component system chemotaxis family response regulator WspR
MKMMRAKKIPLKILLVEDDVRIRETLKNILEQKHYIVSTASNLAQAKSFVADNVFAAVISDLLLANESGLDLVESVRAKNIKTFFFLVTGQGTMETAIEGIRKNIDEYLLKPVDPKILLQLLEKRLEGFTARANHIRVYDDLVSFDSEIIVKAEKISNIDNLTGVFNKKALYSHLSNEIYRAKRQKLSLAFMMCDVDGFKQYNDTYGHTAGDVILKDIGSIINNSIRQYVDLVFRFGGDEFGVVVPGIESKDALCLGNRIVENITKKFKKNNISMSIGISCLKHEAEIDANAFIGAADKNLYAAKKAGKNRVILR